MLVKWEPYTEFEKTFENFFRRPFSLRPFGEERAIEGRAWQPEVNVYEDKEKLSIEAQLPGIEMKDVNLSVTDHTLQIRGERKVEHKGNEDGYHFREAHYGTFARSFSLPSYVDPDQAKATYDRGVLTISVLKQEKAEPRTIEISAQ